MARSTRQRKQVNYRQLLGDASEGSDDDFEDGPPSKKSRGSVPVNNRSSGDKSKGREAQIKPAAEAEVSKKQGRPSREEKDFKRQLERAIKASSSESTSVSSDVSETASVGSKSTAAQETRDDDFVPDKTAESSDESEEENYSEEDEDSDFSVSPQLTKTKKKGKEKIKSPPKAKQTKAKKTAKAQVNKERVSSECLSEENTAPVVKKATQMKSKVKKSSPLVAKNSLNTGIASSNSAISRTGSPAAVLGVNRRSVNWTPPSRVGEEKTKVDSSTPKPARVLGSGGGTPVIRVGLSRNSASLQKDALLSAPVDANSGAEQCQRHWTTLLRCWATCCHSQVFVSLQLTKMKKKGKEKTKSPPKAKQTKAKKTAKAQVNKERVSSECLSEENTEPVVKKVIYPDEE